MRIYNEWIKTTLKEDKEILRTMVDCLLADPNPEQTKVLAAVKKYMIDQSVDLMVPLYEQLLVICTELNVEPPVRQFDPENPTSASWYVIPAIGSLHAGYDQQQRLQKRKAKRERDWTAFVAAAGFTHGEVDVLLANEDTKLGEVRASFLHEINRSTRLLKSEMDNMAAKLAAMQVEIDELKMTSDATAEWVLTIDDTKIVDRRI